VTTFDSDTAVAVVEERLEELLASHDPATTDFASFRGAQYDLGLAWVHFPEGWGGLGLPPKSQTIVERRLREAGAKSPDARVFFGLTMAGPTVVTHGDDALRSRLLRRMFTGEDAWCQLFSEPGAGSDLAGLACKAVRDGDEWVVTGQKVWNTLAHIADLGMLVTRTHPDLPKHRGMTYFAVDMHAPGVDVRPLRQITGEAEFNEVYLTDVRVPDADRIGAEGEGWRVSLTTLMNERVSIGGVIPAKGSGTIRELVKTWQQLPEERRDSVGRDAVMKLWIRAELLRLTNIRAAQNRKMGDPGPEGSIAKMASADLNKDIYEMVVDLMGAEGMLYGSYDRVRPETAMGYDTLQKAFLRSRANSIEGGTTEVMKNILGERVLGLPGDVRVDRDVPWSQVPRN
jgi:alkylation response protein AidB-like acyl-CoA dehydrogenase